MIVILWCPGGAQSFPVKRYARKMIIPARKYGFSAKMWIQRENVDSARITPVPAQTWIGYKKDQLLPI